MATWLLTQGAKEVAKAAGAELGKAIGKEVIGLKDGTEQQLTQMTAQLQKLQRDISALQTSVNDGFFRIAELKYTEKRNWVEVKYDQMVKAIETRAQLSRPVIRDPGESEKDFDKRISDRHTDLASNAGHLDIYRTKLVDKLQTTLKDIHDFLVAGAKGGFISMVATDTMTNGDNLLTCYVQLRSWFLNAIGLQAKGICLIGLIHGDTTTATDDIKAIYANLEAQEADLTARFGKNNSMLAKSILDNPSNYFHVNIKSPKSSPRQYIEPVSEWYHHVVNRNAGQYGIGGVSHEEWLWKERLQFGETSMSRSWVIQSREFRDSNSGINENGIYTCNLWSARNCRKTGYVDNSFVWETTNKQAFGWKLKPAPGDKMMIVYADENMFAHGNDLAWDASTDIMSLQRRGSPLPWEHANQLFEISLAPRWGTPFIDWYTGWLMPGVQMYSANQAFYLEISSSDCIPRIYRSGTTYPIWEFTEWNQRPDSLVGLGFAHVKEGDKKDTVAMYLRSPAGHNYFTNAPGETAYSKSIVLDDDGVLRFKAGDKIFWASRWVSNAFYPIYHEGEPGNGLGGVRLRGGWDDRAFALDFESKGSMDHILVQSLDRDMNERGIRIAIVKYDNGQWVTKYENRGHRGLNLGNALNLGNIAYDYESSGKMDHVFSPAFNSDSFNVYKALDGDLKLVTTSVTSGQFGNFILDGYYDGVIAFDYDHSGKMDHLVAYRPGGRKLHIVKPTRDYLKNPFQSVFERDNGIAGYDLSSTADRVLAYDWDSSGKMDHLVIYRAGQGIFCLLKHVKDDFEIVLISHTGIEGHNLKDYTDRIMAYDWTGSGKLDHLIIYGCGTGSFWVLQRDGGRFKVVYAMDQGGIGGYDLKSDQDHMFCMDAEKRGTQKNLVCYRSNKTGTIWVLSPTG